MGDVYDAETCNTRLQLGLAFGGYVADSRQEMSMMTTSEERSRTCLDLSFTLLKKPEKIGNSDDHQKVNESNLTMDFVDQDEEDRKSSDGGGSDIVTKSKFKDGARNKKLRLTKDQTALLESSFKRHSTLTPNQKYALAAILNLNHRQVEVWFQNRRARTKLKQTEVDCEYLKKRCQSLGVENQRLKKELKELKSLSVNEPKTEMLSTSLCTSCERKASTNNEHYHPNNEAAMN